MKYANRQGFTITEIIIVVIIISLAAAFAIPQFTKALAKNEERYIISQLLPLQSAVDLYYERNGNYPGDLNDTAAVNAQFNLTLSDQGKFYIYCLNQGNGLYSCSGKHISPEWMVHFQRSTDLSDGSIPTTPRNLHCELESHPCPSCAFIANGATGAGCNY